MGSSNLGAQIIVFHWQRQEGERKMLRCSNKTLLSSFKFPNTNWTFSPKSVSSCRSQWHNAASGDNIVLFHCNSIGKWGREQRATSLGYLISAQADFVCRNKFLKKKKFFTLRLHMADGTDGTLFTVRPYSTSQPDLGFVISVSWAIYCGWWGVKVGVSLGKFSWQGFLQNRSQCCQLGSSVARSDDFPDPLGGLTCQKRRVAHSDFSAVWENGNDNATVRLSDVLNEHLSHAFNNIKALWWSQCDASQFFHLWISKVGNVVQKLFHFQPVEVRKWERCWDSRFILLKAETTYRLIYTKSST